MDDTLKTLLLLGIGYLFIESRSSTPVTYTTGTGLPNTINPYTGLTPSTIATAPVSVQSGPVASTMAPQIAQQIQTQNLQISAGGSLATAAVGTLAAAHVLALSIAGPIGAAIAAAVILVETLVSDTHLYANALVQKYENPFGQNFIAVIQAVTNALQAGTLTQTEVNAAYQGLNQAWINYESTMHELQTEGSQWNIVATQSLNNLNNEYVGTTLSNGTRLGPGEGGAYGSIVGQGFVYSWLQWLQNLMNNPQVIAA